MRLAELVANRWFGRLLLAILLGGAFLLLTRDPEQLKVLSRLGGIELGWLLAVNLLSFLATAAVSWHLLHAVGAGVPWSINLALTFLANFINYFGPAQPGMGAKALYLKTARQVRYTDFAVATAANALVMVLMSGLLGSLLVVWLWWGSGVALPELGVLSLGMVLGVALLPSLWARLPRFADDRRRWVRVMGSAVEGIARLGRQRGAMARSALLVLIQYAVAGIAVWLSYRAIGADLGYPLALLVAVFLSVANIVPVTPNNVGISELVMGAVTQLGGADFATGLIAGAVMRACHLAISLGGLPYAHWRLHRVPGGG